MDDYYDGWDEYDEGPEQEPLKFCVSFTNVSNYEEMKSKISSIITRLPQTQCQIGLLEDKKPVLIIDFEYYLPDDDPAHEENQSDAVDKCWKMIDRSLKGHSFVYERVSEVREWLDWVNPSLA